MRIAEAVLHAPVFDFALLSDLIELGLLLLPLPLLMLPPMGDLIGGLRTFEALLDRHVLLHAVSWLSLEVIDKQQDQQLFKLQLNW